MQTNARTPCPNRIYEDSGVAFAIGAIGGTLFQIGTAIMSRSKGMFLKRLGTRLRYRVPPVCGNFALWGFSFSFSDCALNKIGIKNPTYSAILSGGVTGGLLASQRGARHIRSGTIFGFLMLFLIESAIKLAENMSAEGFSHPQGSD